MYLHSVEEEECWFIFLQLQKIELKLFITSQMRWDEIIYAMAYDKAGRHMKRRRWRSLVESCVFFFIFISSSNHDNAKSCSWCWMHECVCYWRHITKQLKSLTNISQAGDDDNRGRKVLEFFAKIFLFPSHLTELKRLLSMISLVWQHFIHIINTHWCFFSGYKI